MKKAKFSIASLAGLALSAALTLGASSAAQAFDGDDDIFWSVTMSSPGVRVGMSNAPVVVQPPIHVHPRPVYMPPPRVVYMPPPPPPRYYGYGHPGYYGRDIHRGHGRWDDRHDRNDRHARNDHRDGFNVYRRGDDGPRGGQHGGPRGHERGGDRGQPQPQGRAQPPLMMGR